MVVPAASSARAFFAGAACFAALIVAPPARADEEASGGGGFSPVEELRLGGFDHDLDQKEGPSIDASVEALSSPSFYGGGDRLLAALADPRIAVGAMLNARGLTSYGFAGLNWRFPVAGPVFVEGELGGAFNSSPRGVAPGRIDIGCPVTFRESAGLGYALTDDVDVVASVEHISHAGLCGRINPGLTDVGVRIGYRF